MSGTIETEGEQEVSQKFQMFTVGTSGTLTHIP